MFWIIVYEIRYYIKKTKHKVYFNSSYKPNQACFIENSLSINHLFHFFVILLFFKWYLSGNILKSVAHSGKVPKNGL